MKSPLPDLDLQSGEKADINTLLSLVEDIIRHRNRVSGDFYTHDSKKDDSKILSLNEVNLQGKNWPLQLYMITFRFFYWLAQFTFHLKLLSWLSATVFYLSEQKHLWTDAVQNSALKSALKCSYVLKT